MAGKHFILVGGVATNDTGSEDDCETNHCAGHDMAGTQFLEQAIDVATALGDAANTVVLYYAPSYRFRGMNEKQEDPRVYDVHAKPHADNVGARARFFHDWTVKYCAASQLNLPATNLVACYSAKDMISHVKAGNPIKSIFYFGHSGATEMILDFDLKVSHDGNEKLTANDFSCLSAHQFADDPYFITFGCLQGLPDGFCQRVISLLPVTAIGCDRKTNYALAPTPAWGPNAWAPQPSTNGVHGYRTYGKYVWMKKEGAKTLLGYFNSTEEIPPPFPSNGSRR